LKNSIFLVTGGSSLLQFSILLGSHLKFNENFYTLYIELTVGNV
jgi:hypothetical protein